MPIYNGGQILPLFNNCMDDVYIAVRKVCRVPWTTHCNLLPHLAGVMDPDLWFSKRCIKIIKMTLNSNNIIDRSIIGVGLNGTHSIMGGNWRHLMYKYGMEECKVMKIWDEKCKNECESVIVCE